MKLFPLLAAAALTLGAAPAQAAVDAKVAKQCKEARDFVGCVKAFTTAPTVEDPLQPLRNAMKIVAERMDSGTSLVNATATFQPVVDQLAIVEEANAEDPTVKGARKAVNLFGLLKSAWQARISDASQYRLNSYMERDDMYNCEILKQTADAFDAANGYPVINWQYTKGLFGWTTCKVPSAQLPEAYMYSHVTGLLRSGAMSTAERAKVTGAFPVAKFDFTTVYAPPQN